MATTKRPNTIGKEKRVLPATASSKTTSSKPTVASPLNKSISPYHKQTPNYLKPTLTSRLNPHSQSRPSATHHASLGETLNRRRHSLEKTQPSPSSPNLLRQKQPPPPSSSSRSRLQKALLSPGPRLRAAPPLRPAAPSSLSAKRATVSVSSKPVTDQRTSKTVVRVGKTQSLQQPKRASSARGVITKRSSIVTSNKKAIGGGSASSTKARKITAKTVSVEAEKQIETVKDIEEHIDNEVGSICEIEEDVNFFTGNDIQLEDEKLISIVEEEIQANLGIAEEEETDQNVEEEKNTKIEEISNNESKPDDQGATEADEEGIDVSEENHNENFNGDDDNIEEEGDNNNDKVEESRTVEKQAAAGKMESDGSLVSNDLIEETACRLRETSKRNRVLALAGAFQTVIDYQTK